MLKISKVIIFSLFLILLVIQQPGFSNASKIDELKNQIEERNSNMSELEKEIEMYQKQLEEVGAEKQTLNNEIYRLNLNKKKLSSDISLTNNKISLSLKALKKDPWENIEEKYKKGDIVNGKATKFNSFGAFIQISTKIQGLCHVSEFGSAQKMEETLKIGEKYDFQIISIEPKEHRMSLKINK